MINFVLDEYGDWTNTEARLATPNTIFTIYVKTVTSRFNHDLPPRYYVVLDYSDEHGHRKDMPLKFFDSLTDAKSFAAKQATILNGDD